MSLELAQTKCWTHRCTLGYLLPLPMINDAMYKVFRCVYASLFVHWLVTPFVCWSHRNVEFLPKKYDANGKNNQENAQNVEFA